MPLRTSTGPAVAPSGGAREASALARVEAVETVIAAIRQRLDRPFELEEMARIAYLSPFYFNRVFRQVTGLPPRRFQTALRMLAAKRLLLTTDLSVTDICLEVGYRSLGTFTTQFRELVGVSPRTLRRLGEGTWSVSTLRASPTVAGGLAGSTITGLVSIPDLDRITFVGAFPDRSPMGMPRACAVLGGATVRYHLTDVPSGRHYIAAAAVPWSTDPRSYLLPDESSVLVGVADAAVLAFGTSSTVRHVRLRPMCTTDPPILLAPHAIL